MSNIWDGIQFTGANARAVHAWIHDVGGMRGDFVARSATASTGGQAWRYVAANAAPDTHWPTTVRGAVLTHAGWVPVNDGDTIYAVSGGDEDRDYVVLNPAQVVAFNELRDRLQDDITAALEGHILPAAPAAGSRETITNPGGNPP